MSASASNLAAPGATSQTAIYSNPEASGLPSPAELEQTLQRLVRRVAMMVQAEKCVFLLNDPDHHELVARPPALGLTAEQLQGLRVPLNAGISGAVFMSAQPRVVHNGQPGDPLDLEWMQRLDIRNMIGYPLVVERRDEQERVADRITVGVLHVINKRGGGNFTEEDVRLLSIMARQVTAVITDAQIYLRLTEEKEQLQATLHSLLTGVIMVESTGYISLMNMAARQMFGLEGAVDPSGQRYDAILTQQPIIEMLQNALAIGREQNKEIELPAAEEGEDGRTFQAQTALVRSQREGTSTVLGVVAVFNDITQIRNVDRMKTAFVSTVSHELRTPLTSIKGFVSTLLQDSEGYFDQETRIEFYEIIDSECDRLRRLIDDLLNVSRIESGRALQMNWSTFNPGDIIEKVLQAQRSYTDKHPLRYQPQGTLPTVLGDSDKFDQIMTNLISNAIKYSPAGGDVTVAAHSDEASLTVSVSDPGIGIPPDKLARVFEKFERVDNRDTRQAGGTGIGLFLVKHLVERHDGKIWVESEVGRGSSFTFKIPLKPAQAVKEMGDLEPRHADEFDNLRDQLSVR